MRYLLHHMLYDSVARCPEREAIVDAAQRLDYREVLGRVEGLAGRLIEAGIERGDRVAIYLPPTTSLPLTIFAVARAGAVFVPIHHHLFPDQVRHILADCGAVALVTETRRWEGLREQLDSLPALRFAVVQGDASSAGPCATYDFSDWLQASPAGPPEPAAIEKDLAAILYTSGSTGKPKGVMLSHANVLAGAEIVADYLHLGDNERLLAALPFSFDAGLNQLTTAMLRGGTTVMTEFRFGRDLVRRLQEEAITGLAGVPSLWSLLVQPSSGLGKQPLPALRYITNTGGAMPRQVLTQLRGQLPTTDIFLMYGLTEAFRSTYLPPAEIDRRPDSIGKAIPNTEIMVLNESGQPCQPGEVGELVHHGPTVSLGYWGHPELTEKVLRPHPCPPPGEGLPDRVCYSGDLVRRDQDGFLYFVSRRDNQIKSAGFRISPNEVEEVICRLSAVRQAAVVGVPDAVLGQRLVALVVPAEACQIDPDDVLAHCAGSMPRHMVPKRIEVMDILPMTSSGKVNYPLLRERFASENPSCP